MTGNHQSGALTQTTAWGGREIAYRLSFERARRNLAITVHPDLRVTVVAPEGRSVEEVAERVQRRAGWIAKQLRQFERWHPLPAARRYVPGESHLYLGRQYRLRVARGPEGVSVVSGRLVVQAPSELTAPAIRRAVADWYGDRAHEVFARRLDRLKRIAPRLTGQPTRVRVRRMPRRWGSCSPRGTVTLNPELVKAPLSCIDYVLVHELCHRIVPDHSSRFFRLLAAHVPDWERRRERLNGLRP
jgi:predicted metal-dependent hydrolase